MLLKLGLLLLVTCIQLASANGKKADHPSALPSRLQIEACQRASLLLRPGVIENQRVINRHGDYWIQYEIHRLDSSAWSVVCDLRNGEIIREQRRVEKKSNVGN